MNLKILLQNINEAKEVGCNCNFCGQSIPEEFNRTQIRLIESIKLVANEYKKTIDIIGGTLIRHNLNVNMKVILPKVS